MVRRSAKVSNSFASRLRQEEVNSEQEISSKYFKEMEEVPVKMDIKDFLRECHD